MAVNPKYITTWLDRHGRRRHYFRYRGQKYKLPGKPGSAQYVEALARYLAAKEAGTLGCNNLAFIAGSIGWTIEKYLAHKQGLLQHSESTQRVYRLYCDIVKREVGQFKISDLTPVAVRAMRDSVALKHKASVADMAVMMTSALWRFAVEYLRLPLGHNPAFRVSKLHTRSRPTKRWSADVLKKFQAAASPTVNLGFALLLHTAQRESDVVTMRWDQIDWQHPKGGAWLHIVQRKTREPVWIPLHPTLRTLLEQTPRVSDFILNSERGAPYKDSNSLASAIRRTLKEIGIEGHSGHGLRVTAACKLKEAGCDDDMVAAITGHTDMRTLRKYLVEVEKQQLAEKGMSKWVAAG